MAVAISPVRLASPRPGVWELSVTFGCDTDPHSWRVYRTVHGSETGASRELAALVADVSNGRALPSKVKADRPKSSEQVQSG